MEIWKDVVEYEGIYSVSSFGKIKRISKMKNLIHIISDFGYHYVSLSKNNIKKKYSVHGLAIRSFIGKTPKGHQINHKDGNKSNNHISNLEYVTPFQNIHHAIKIGLITTRGEKVHTAKLTKENVVNIRNEYIPYIVEAKFLARKYGVSHQTIREIVGRHTWKHLN